MKLYRYVSEIGNFNDMIILGVANGEHISGCVVGGSKSLIHYPIGDYSTTWMGFSEMEKNQSITLESSSNLFSNGESFLIKIKNKKTWCLLSKHDITPVQSRSISFGHTGDNVTLTISSGKRPLKFKKITKVIIKNNNK